MILHEIDGTAASSGVTALLQQFLSGPLETGPTTAAVGVTTGGNLGKMLVPIDFYGDCASVSTAEQPRVRFKRRPESHLIARNLPYLHPIELGSIGVSVIEQVLNVAFREETAQLSCALRRCRH
jgi:hypothetical protein